MFGEEDDVEVKSVCGAVDGIGEEGEGEGDADGGDEWQHTVFIIGQASEHI